MNGITMTALDGPTLRRAMELAAKHGMSFHPTRTPNDRVAAIFCKTCGWPKDHRETSIERYAEEPYGCVDCAPAKEEIEQRGKHHGR